MALQVAQFFWTGVSATHIVFGGRPRAHVHCVGDPATSGNILVV